MQSARQKHWDIDSTSPAKELTCIPGYPALTQKSELEGKLGHEGNTFGHKDAAAQQGNRICAQDYTLG